MSEPAGSRKFFDIAPPGKIAPPSTTKPVIVSNKPEQVDHTITVATQTLTPPTIQPVLEQPAKLVLHEQPTRQKSWLWLIPAVILITIVIGLLEHYHVL